MFVPAALTRGPAQHDGGYEREACTDPCSARRVVPFGRGSAGCATASPDAYHGTGQMLRFYDVAIYTGVDEFIFVAPELKLGLDGLDR